MPLASPKYPFELWAASGAPEEPGLYALYRGQELYCIGIATRREHIRARLLWHLGNDAKQRGITHYQWEIGKDPQAMREAYIRRLAEAPPNCEDGLSRVEGR